jgi:tripartite-type tricarboxylate transporter receptor subunit TctC
MPGSVGAAMRCTIQSSFLSDDGGGNSLWTGRVSWPPFPVRWANSDSSVEVAVQQPISKHRVSYFLMRFQEAFVMLQRFTISVLFLGIAYVNGGTAYGQSFPNKPIRFVTTAPGSSADLAARLTAQALSIALGQQVVVDGQGGASGAIAAQMVARSSPDGYTLLYYGSGIWTLPLLQTVAYDPIKDFLPVTLAVSAPNVLVVHPSLPTKSVKDLIALAKAKPGQLDYASGGTGSSNHLAAELFKSMANVMIVRIPYKGTGPATTAIMGGEVQLMFPAAAAAAPYIKTGRLRALAVGSADPSPLTPGLPTVAASGLPGYESSVTIGVFAPAKTSLSIVNHLNEEIVRVLNQPDVKDSLFRSGVEVVGSTPDRFLAVVKAEMAKYGKVIKEARITSD